MATTHCVLRECFQLGPTLSGIVVLLTFFIKLSTFVNIYLVQTFKSFYRDQNLTAFVNIYQTLLNFSKWNHFHEHMNSEYLIVIFDKIYN